MTNTCIITCDHFKQELKTAVASDDFQDVSTASFPARCGRPPITWEDMAAIVTNHPELRQVHILGGCCVAGLKDPPQDLAHCRVHQVEQCFHLFADSQVTDACMLAGNYLITPGWLVHWRAHMKKWGFDEITAPEFFKESMQSLLMIDTGVHADSVHHLEEFAEYAGLPFSIMKTGIGFFRLFLSQILLKARIDQVNHQSLESLNKARKQSAEYATAMDLMNTLTRQIHEEKAIEDIIDVFTMLFAPQDICYLSIENDLPGNIYKSFSSSPDDDDAMKNRLMQLDQDYAWTASNQGFCLRIKGRDHTLGILEVDHLVFPEHRSHYLNLALTITGVCGLVIDNARIYQNLIQTNQDLERAKVCAENAKRVKSEFLANMTHELRTPLNVILGFTQLMTRDKNLDSEQLRTLSTIRRNGEHLLTLINQVLTMSKIEAKGITLDENDFDFHALLNDLEDMFYIQAEKKGVPVIFHRPDDLPRYIRTDETKLKQVLINLIGNAVKFTSQGKVAVTIKAMPEPEKLVGKLVLRLLFEIKDSGTGMTACEIKQIFEPFVQTDAGRRSREGTGLGLPISLKFVKLMGGDLSVQSEINKGSVFIFHITAGVGKMSGIACDSKERRVAALAPGHPCYRILIVDDRKDNRLLLVKLLESVRFEVQEAENGLKAVELFKTWHPDLIWMDMCMPVMDGYTASKQIKALSKERTVPVIALTASVIEEEEIIISKGFDGYLRKPFQEADIFRMMEHHLGVEFTFDESPDADHLKPEAACMLQDASIPPEIGDSMRQAILQLEDDRLLDVIDQLHHQDAALAALLKNKAEQYDYDGILELLNRNEAGK